MKTIKKLFFFYFILMSGLIIAQESIQDIDYNKKAVTQFSFKQKIGFSTLEIGEFEPIEGNLLQFDMMMSNSIAEKISLEYGLRFSRFRANFTKDGQQLGVENFSFAVPVGIVYVKDLNQNVSLLYGIHVYGSYMQSLEIGNLIDEEDLGINVGLGAQGGAIFNLNPKTDFAVLIDFQGDLNKLKKDDLKFKHTNTALVSFNFYYKL